MERATPVQMRKALEAVEALRKAGIEFVPIPVVSSEDRAKLLGIMMKRVEDVAIQAEKEAPCQAE